MSTRAATHYELIGLSREATPEEIKSAFRAQAQIHHPDAGGDATAFTELSAAYEVLADPDRRATYDATLPATGASRFSGWSRPAASERAGEENDLPRRRPIVDDAGDDPMVFRRRTNEPASTHAESSAPNEETGRDFGSVAGIEKDSVSASNDPAATVTVSDERLVPPRENNLDLHDRPRARRFRFFGRGGSEPEDTDAERNEAFTRRRPASARSDEDDSSSPEQSRRSEERGRAEQSDRRSDTEPVVGGSRLNRDSGWMDTVKPVVGRSEPSRGSSWLDDVEPVVGEAPSNRRGSSWLNSAKPVIGKSEPSRGSSWLDDVEPVVGETTSNRGSSWLDSAKPVVGKTKPSRGSSWLDDVEPVVGEQKRWRR